MTIDYGAISRLQAEADTLSDAKQAIDAELQQFPHSHQLYGPVPDSGAWLDHLRTPSNELTAAKYDAMVARRDAVQALVDANVALIRAIEDAG